MNKATAAAKQRKRGNVEALAVRQKAIQRFKDEGFVLVKLRPEGKRPIEPKWNKLPYRSKFNSKQNYGIVLQHDQLVIDVDPRNFLKGINTFTELRKVVDLPKTFIVKTGGGGFHYFYKKPADLIIKKKVYEYRHGIEFLSKNCYVVAVGSIHPETKDMYKPYKGSKLADMVDAPAELLNLIAETNPKTHAPRHRQAKYMEDDATVTRYQFHLQNTDGAVQGEAGDNHTFTVAAFGKDLGLPPDTVYEMMLDNWNNKCDPPWGIKELKTKVKNAFEYGSNEIGCSSYTNLFGTDAKHADNVPTLITDKGGWIVTSFMNCCYYLSSKAIKYVGAGQTTTKPEINPLGGHLRYNELKNRLEFSTPAPWHIPKDVTKEAFKWETVEASDAEIVNIKYYLDKLTGLAWSKMNIQDAVVKVSHDNKYNPVVDWLDGVVWDSVERLDTWLVDYCDVKQTLYTQAVGVKTLCAAVARVYHPGIKFDHMLVLEGDQGIGKSMAVKTLGGDWFVDIMLRSDSKDTVQLINSAWIVEVAEMAGLRKAEVESLKAFISRPTDSIRPPFGKTPIDFPRRSIFIGTINPTSLGYLNDETGNRRYWPVLCGSKMNIPSLRRDRDNLFAEALVRYRAGEKLWLSDAAIEAEAIRIQETRSMKHPWLEVVSSYFETYDVQKTTVKDVYIDAINGDFSRMTYTNKALILNIFKTLGWKRNSSGQYVNPRIDKMLDDILNSQIGEN